MNKLNKMVNIYPSMPITTVNPPIRTTVKRVTKSTEEIRACLMARAIVEEVLADGKVTRLNLTNYDKSNSETQSQNNECNCNGDCNCGWKIDIVSTINGAATSSDAKSLWQIEYEKALNGVDLTSMTRKQRRSVIAAARAAADEAVRGNESNTEEVVIGIGTVETVEDSNNEEVQEENDTTEEVVDEVPVETLDVEKINEDDVEETPDSDTTEVTE